MLFKEIIYIGIDMELSHLKSFLTVARKGNLSAAARELGTTQPNLGRQMTALAKEVGMELFVRHSRGMDLTARGKEFFDLCKRIVGELEQETASIREKDSEPHGSLKVVTGIRSTETILNHLHRFTKRFPKLTFTFTSLVDIYSVDPFQFQIGDADVALLPASFEDPDIIQYPLFEMDLRIYASPKYFENHSRPESIDDLKNHQLVVFVGENKEILHFLNFQMIGDYSVDMYQKSFVGVNNGLNMRTALLNGYGIGAYFYDKDLIDNNKLVDVFPDLISKKISYYYTYHKRLEGSPKIKAFYEFLKEIYGISLKNAHSEII
jgi:DNA-binding transcriptional LysR family regulator